MEITQLFTALVVALGIAVMVVLAVVPTWLRWEAEQELAPVADLAEHRARRATPAAHAA